MNIQLASELSSNRDFLEFEYRYNTVQSTLHLLTYPAEPVIPWQRSNSNGGDL